jgi:hypothetical protein
VTDQHDDMADRVAATRAQLFDTLDAIEDKLNVPKQLGIAANKVKRGIDENPKRGGRREYRRGGAPTAVTGRRNAVVRVPGVGRSSA